MGRRFQNIKNGERFKQALDRYKTWQSEAYTRLNNGVGTGQAKSPLIAIELEPFGRDLGGDKALAKVTTDARSNVGTAVGTRVIAATATAVKIAGFKPARIVAFIGTGSSVATTSEITGMRYLKYSGKSYTHPFGRTGTDLEYDSFNAIAAAFLNGQQNRRVSYQAEQWRLV
jgi:hypothetical protein